MITKGTKELLKILRYRLLESILFSVPAHGRIFASVIEKSPNEHRTGVSDINASNHRINHPSEGIGEQFHRCHIDSPPFDGQPRLSPQNSSARPSQSGQEFHVPYCGPWTHVCRVDSAVWTAGRRADYFLCVSSLFLLFY